MKMDAIQLPFGMHDGLLIHISGATRGLACDCTCPSCGERLIARKGAVVCHHFAHASGSQCEGAVETALHIASKQLLSQRGEIALPAVEFQFNSNRAPFRVAPARKYRLDNVQEEMRTGDIVPDLIATVGDRPLIIEVRVTHAVDGRKLQKIQTLGISAIEVDLSRIPRDLAPGPLAEALIDQTENKKWVFNARASELKRSLLQGAEPKQIVERGLALHVDDCPIRARISHGKSYANVIDDCGGCDYCYELNTESRMVICGGREKITTLKQLCSLRTARDGAPDAVPQAPTQPGG